VNVLSEAGRPRKCNLLPEASSGGRISKDFYDLARFIVPFTYNIHRPVVLTSKKHGPPGKGATCEQLDNDL